MSEGSIDNLQPPGELLIPRLYLWWVPVAVLLFQFPLRIFQPHLYGQKSVAVLSNLVDVMPVGRRICLNDLLYW